jgi:peptidoglycan/LPS O-acetylase OafA/YrhL
MRFWSLEAAPSPSARGQRTAALTGVRGVAALWVAFFHYHYWMKMDAWWLTSHGWAAVDLFFVLSGFILTLTVSNHPTWLDFYRARIARTFPLQWAVLAVLIAIAVAGHKMGDPQHTWVGIGANLVMLQGVFTEDFTGPAWSVGVEWGAYLCFPLMAVAAKRWPVPMIALCLLCLLPVVGEWTAFPFDYIRGLPAFGLGCCFFHVDKRHCGLVSLPLFAIWWACDLPMMFAFASAFLVAGCRHDRWLHYVFGLRPIEYLGDISYSIYLIHMPTIVAVSQLRRLFDVGTLPWCFASLALVVVISAVSYKFLEVPSRRWIRRFHLPRVNRETARLGV